MTALVSQMGMGRTDSEAAFQEFLKRIPSASNLAAIAGSTGQLGWRGSDLSALDLLPSSSALLPSIAPLPGAEGSGATAPGMPGMQHGVPHVTSMDFLARLVGQPSLSLHQPPPIPVLPKMEQEAPSGMAAMPPVQGQGQAMPLVVGGQFALPSSALVVNPLAMQHAAAAAQTAAAAIQLQGQLSRAQQQGQQQMHTSSHQVAMPLTHKAANSRGGDAYSHGHHNRASSSHVNSASSRSDDDDDDLGGHPTDRKARRMLSNRESARRSRKRKQEHLSKLEGELADMEREKNRFAEHAVAMERRSQTAEEENRRVRDENNRLKDELAFLRETSQQGGAHSTKAFTSRQQAPKATSTAEMRAISYHQQLSERKAQRSGWKADGHQQPEVEDANAAGASKRGRRD